MGTRHRAAIGVSEESDAVAIVVSEETGQISLALEGQIHRRSDPEHLRARLQALVAPRRAGARAEENAYIGL
jgi:diadenylate cyclase